MRVAHKVKLKNALGLFAANVPQATTVPLCRWLPLRLLIKFYPIKTRFNLKWSIGVFFGLFNKAMCCTEEFLKDDLIV